MWFWKRRDERRRWPRSPCRATGVFCAGRMELSGAVLDLGCGGCLFQPSRTPLFIERHGMLSLGGARLAVRLVGQDRRGHHLSFGATLSDDQEAGILLAVEAERLGLSADRRPGAKERRLLRRPPA